MSSISATRLKNVRIAHRRFCCSLGFFRCFPLFSRRFTSPFLALFSRHLFALSGILLCSPCVHLPFPRAFFAPSLRALLTLSDICSPCVSLAFSPLARLPFPRTLLSSRFRTISLPHKKNSKLDISEKQKQTLPR